MASLWTVAAIFVAFAIFGSSSLELPSYIRKCKEDELKTCGPEAANEVWPILSKGDPELGIPSYLPLKLNDIQINQPDLQLSLKNCELEGFETLHVYKTEWDNVVGNLSFTMDTLTLNGEFEKGGKIYEISFAQPGWANFTLEKVNVEFSTLFTTTRSELGRSTRIFKPNFVVVEPQFSKFSFGQIGSSLPFLSFENSRRFTDALQPTFQDVLYFAYSEILNKIVKLFKVEDVLQS